MEVEDCLGGERRSGGGRRGRDVGMGYEDRRVAKLFSEQHERRGSSFQTQKTQKTDHHLRRKKFDSSPAIVENCWVLCEWGNGVAGGSAVRCHGDGVPGAAPRPRQHNCGLLLFTRRGIADSVLFLRFGVEIGIVEAFPITEDDSPIVHGCQY